MAGGSDPSDPEPEVLTGTTTMDYNDYTIAELQSMLDEAGIDYKSNQLKAYYVDLAETNL